MGGLLFKLTQLHLKIADEYLEKILIHAGNKNAVSAAVWTPAALDVNLALFEVLGRLSMRGLWLVWDETVAGTLPTTFRPIRNRRVHAIAERVCALVASNPALASPVMDEQVIDLALAFTFLAAHGGFGAQLKDWLQHLAGNFQKSFVLHRKYPCIHTDYVDLLEHPRQDNEYREQATSASVLFPTLAFWAAATGDMEALGFLSRFRKEHFSHSTLQIWLPHDNSEPHLYLNDAAHGAAYTDIPVAADPNVILKYLLAECRADTPFFKLSAVEQGFWPLVLVACRHHRLPVPPHLWPGLLPSRMSAATAAAQPELTRVNFRGPLIRRSHLMSTTTWLP